VDCVTSGLLLEQIAYGDFNMSYVNLLTSLCGSIIASHAQEFLKERWLKPILAGDKLVAIALTEPSAGSDAARLRLRRCAMVITLSSMAKRPPFHWPTSRTWLWCLPAPAPTRTAPKASTAFLVPMDLPGLTRTAFDDVAPVPSAAARSF